jgi:hypothetical protein
MSGKGEAHTQGNKSFSGKIDLLVSKAYRYQTGEIQD